MARTSIDHPTRGWKGWCFSVFGFRISLDLQVSDLGFHNDASQVSRGSSNTRSSRSIGPWSCRWSRRARHKDCISSRFPPASRRCRCAVGRGVVDVMQVGSVEFSAPVRGTWCRHCESCRRCKAAGDGRCCSGCSTECRPSFCASVPRSLCPGVGPRSGPPPVSGSGSAGAEWCTGSSGGRRVAPGEGLRAGDKDGQARAALAFEAGIDARP